MTGVMVDLACTNTPLSYGLQNSGTLNLVLGTAGLPAWLGSSVIGYSSGHEIGVSLADSLTCYVALAPYSQCI